MNTDFIESERKENIFYGDIFKIGGYGCLFFGHGKTKAGRSAIDIEEDEIALDFACLTNKGKDLYGHFDIGVRHKDVEDSINKRIKIDYLIRMLSKEETISNFKGKPIITEVDLPTFIKVSEFNITFDTDFNNISEIPMPISNRKKIERFRLLVKDHNIKKCLLVPWMDSHLEKGKLLKSYINRDNK